MCCSRVVPQERWASLARPGAQPGTTMISPNIFRTCVHNVLLFAGVCICPILLRSAHIARPLPPPLPGAGRGGGWRAGSIIPVVHAALLLLPGLRSCLDCLDDKRAQYQASGMRHFHWEPLKLVTAAGYDGVTAEEGAKAKKELFAKCPPVPPPPPTPVPEQLPLCSH